MRNLAYIIQSHQAPARRRALILPLKRANMSLHLSEAPFYADLGSGDFQSLLVLNPLSPANDLQAMPTFSWVDSHEKAKMAGEELCLKHEILVSRWNGNCSGTMKAAARQQTEMAIIVRHRLTYLSYHIHSFVFQRRFSLLSSKSTWCKLACAPPQAFPKSLLLLLPQ